MESIKELQAALLAEHTQPISSFLNEEKGACIVVLKHYRFHKSLSIELFVAPTTGGGKIKNPLVPLNPVDAAFSVTDPVALHFLAAVSRFQNNPTAPKSGADIIALKTILKNPMGLRVFLHNPAFSEKATAGSLQEIQFGKTVRDMTVLVHKKDNFYELSCVLQLNGRLCAPATLDVQYDYFIHSGVSLHLLANMQLVKLVQFFRQRPFFNIHTSKFENFKQEVLDKLELYVHVAYTYVQAATAVQIHQQGLNGATEQLIYLSDMGQYVCINPVMRYGAVEVPVMSKKTVHLQDSKGNVLTQQRNEAAENEFIALLLQQHPDFYEQLESELTYFYLHRNRFLDEDWFLNAFENWRNRGISIFGFSQLKENKWNSHAAKITIGVKSGINWFNTNMDVRFGKQKASLKQLHKSVQNKSRFVQLDDGSMGILPQAWLQRMEGFFSAATIEGEDLITPNFHFAFIRKWYRDEELDETVQQTLRLYEAKLAHVSAIETAPIPKDLRAHLRRYQHQGLSWLNFLHDHQFGGCLADDMGLGKTVQIIAFILLLKEKGIEGTHLIVVPTSLLFNWQKELERFAPSLKVYTFYGAGRKTDHRLFDHHDIVLSTYGTLLSGINYLRRYTFYYVFLDESQQIKNINSQRYHVVSLLKSHNRMVITGTPVENNTLDLYAQLSFACPGLLGSKQSFKDLFSIPIDKFKSSKHAAALQRRVAPFILRRTKAEVAPELPEKTEVILYCPMEEAQRKVYDAYEKELRDFIEATPAERLEQNTIHVLRGLTQLRQICNAPSLLAQEQLQGDGSAKLTVLMEEIDNKAPEHKILIFSQFVAMLQLIRKELDQQGIQYSYLTGATKNREAEVQRFQTSAATRVFLVSLKAGGMGLNLTAADYVYLADPWWNPAVEAQAIDRTHRIGQHKNVVAVRLICPDTIEEKIGRLQEGKKELFTGLIRSGNDLLQNITKEDWLYLLQPHSGVQ